MKKRMRRIYAFFAACLFSLSLTACQPAAETETAGAQTETMQADAGETSAKAGVTSESSQTLASGHSQMEVHFLDVGQGDSSLILCDGHAMLIDAGENDKGTQVQLYLQQQGVEQLDYVIATHPDSDHIGGMDVILYKFPVDTVLMTDESKDTQTYQDVVQVIQDKNIHCEEPEQGDVYTLGSASFTVVSTGDAYEDVNDTSIGIRLSYGETDFLFCGDATETAEDDMLASGENLEAEVYKVSHHGSSTSSQTDFLDAIDPEYGVISCGEDNDYGHPHEEVMERLEERNVKVFRTDEQGSITAVTDGRTIAWSSEPTESAVETDEKEQTETQDTGAAKSNTSGGENAEDTAAPKYILNTNTKKFHRPECSSVDDMNEENKQMSDQDRETLISEGYSPCKRCDP
ncbi:MAG TPA: MBL fold metallo-hydrolase [Candidatus Onthocola gallistercoris]|uniref:MBL fold metallo-hydrolase n=1 Tax=Candidatus Onthocola gallistercoris TaxID=2840876 RepID=A0A9D1KV10_9FIRM|nr:MBL fold metallo-hydrolase [Candidatus Onthocola gallistercoris]